MLRIAFYLICLVTIYSLACPQIVHACDPQDVEEWYVRADFDECVNTPCQGESWDDAFGTLQEALAVADDCDVIKMETGTYLIDGTRSSSFALPDGATIEGGWSPYDNDRHVDHKTTILGGDISNNDRRYQPGFDLCIDPVSVGCGLFYDVCAAVDCFGDQDGVAEESDLNRADNAYHVVVAEGLSAATVLDGLTITSGNANGYEPGEFLGGGILVSGGSLTIRDCLITGNRGEFGGGIAVIGGGQPVIEHTRIEENWSAESGGGIYVSDTGSRPKQVSSTA